MPVPTLNKATTDILQKSLTVPKLRPNGVSGTAPSHLCLLNLNQALNDRALNGLHQLSPGVV